jgi:hypothetical protein
MINTSSAVAQLNVVGGYAGSQPTSLYFVNTGTNVWLQSVAGNISSSKVIVGSPTVLKKSNMFGGAF